MRKTVQLIVLFTFMGATSLLPAADGKAATLAPKLGVPFQDHAVLQQKIAVPVWGESLPGAKVTITFERQEKTAVADKEGKWRVVLDPMTAPKLKTVNDRPEGKTMTIVCEKNDKKESTELKDILVGEVWFCAGQSNMAGRMKRAGHPKNYPPDSVDKAKYPSLRLLNTEKWLVCSPETAVWFSRVAFFFVRRVQRDALVPMGVIVRAVGGSNIESWLNQPPYKTGGNYSKLVTPVVGYAMRGMVWYQGESNQNDGRKYQPKLESLISGWRKAWNQADSKDADGPTSEFSAYYVQLPGIGVSPTDNPAMGDGRAEIRQAYFETLAVKNTGMAIALDVGAKGEHPPNKYDTGVRLARLALHNDYGFKDLVPSGPLYKSHTVEGNTVRISFRHTGSGLMLAEKKGFQPPTSTPDAELKWVSVQGADGSWHWADATIDGSELLVTSKDVEKPIAVRYAYTNRPTGPLLYNEEGLPAGPFTTCGYDAETKVRASRAGSDLGC